MLVGRGEECAAVDRLLLEARESRSGALVIRDEPGVFGGAATTSEVGDAVAARV